MNLLKKWRLFRVFSQIVPSRNEIKWLHDDAVTLNTFLKTPCGRKMQDYLNAFLLHQQDRAISSANTLKFNAGACNGSKAILAQIVALGEPENFTDEEGSD